MNRPPHQESKTYSLKNKFKEEIVRAYKHKRLIVGIIAFLVLAAIYFFKDSYSITLRYSTFLGVMILFYLIDHFFYIRFEFKHYVLVIIIAVSTILMSHLYFIHPQYDKIQHFFIPIFICSIVFFMVYRLRLALKWKITFTVLSVIALLGIFEILEYVLDLLFNFKLQGVYLRDLSGLEKFNLLLNPLDDTMMDLAFGIAGSSVYALYAWLRYSRKEKKALSKHI
jgi:hypothetical protein